MVSEKVKRKHFRKLQNIVRPLRPEPPPVQPNGPPIGELIGAVLARVDFLPAFAASRGIVTCAGGGCYNTNAYVLFRLLRELGCELPIECWYIGERERDERWERIVEPLNVTLVDARHRGFVGNPFAPADLKFHGGWGYSRRELDGYSLKAYALLHCGFRQALFLDADNNPARDPSEVFEWPEFVKSGLVLWPDAPNCPAGPKMEVFGLPESAGGDKVNGIETGQIVADKSRLHVYAAMYLANWFNEHAQPFYTASWGDKETFQTAARWVGFEPAIVPHLGELLPSGVLRHRDFEGEPFLFHRVSAAKWRTDGCNAWTPGFPHDELCRRALLDLSREWEPVEEAASRPADRLRPWALPWHEDRRARGIPCRCLTVTAGAALATCERFGPCTVATRQPGIACCATCPSYQSPPALAPTSTITIPLEQRPRPWRAFNGGHVTWRGRRLLAYRSGNREARLWLAELDDDWRPKWQRPLKIQESERCGIGCEDPRLFVAGGKLHLAFGGQQQCNGKLVFNQMLAGLADDLTVAWSVYLDYPDRAESEKNWGFFEHAGELLAVYSIAPHRVVRIVEGRAALAWETPNPLPWHHGALRGGAPPVRVGDEYYSWFHGHEQHGGEHIYAMGLYTFDAAPPFRPRRIVPEAVLLADTHTRPSLEVAHVVFPLGAEFADGKWTVTYGDYDTWQRVAEFDGAAVEAALTPRASAI